MDSGAAVQKHLQEPDDPDVVDFDSGVGYRADGDRQGQPLQQRKIHVYVEARGSEAGKAIRDGLESLAYSVEMVESLFQAEVMQIVGTEFVAQVAREFLVVFQKGVLPVGAKT